MRRMTGSWPVFGLFVLHLMVDVAVAQFAVGGVYVDPEGVVRRATRELDTTGFVRASRPNEDVAKPARRRCISLARLEQQLLVGTRRRAAERVLAGLHRIDAVHLLPDDVLVAGPAEGWMVQPDGEIVGTKSGRPVVRLDDLLVALRFAFAEESTASTFGCSIDPTEEGLRRVAQVNQRLRRQRVNAAQLAAAMQQAMGPQDVKVFGVRGDTSFGLGLVAADATLKRLAMGHEPIGVDGVPSYVELAGRTGGASGGLLQNRFWFVAAYDEIRASSDGRSFELHGGGMRLRGTAPRPGRTRSTERSERNTPAGRFADAFNEHLDELVAEYPELAGLQNRIALAVVAELAVQPHRADVSLEDEGEEERPRFWYPSAMIDGKGIDGKRIEIVRVPVPKSVPSLAGVQRTRRGQALVHVSGGVEVDPAAIVESTARKPLEQAVPARPADPSRWWWDLDVADDAGTDDTSVESEALE